MKKALIEYSKAFVVPEVSASQPARGMPAIPARPLSTASARIAKRSNESVDSLNRGVVMAVMLDPFFVGFLSDRCRSRRRNLSHVWLSLLTCATPTPDRLEGSHARRRTPRYWAAA